MRIIQVTKRQINLDEYIKRSALTTDFSTLISEPCIIIDSETKQPVAVYGILKEGTTDILREAVLRIKIGKNKRTKGLRTLSKIFGYMPRETIRKDYCSSVSLARDQPKEHAVVCGFAKVLTEYYSTYAPEVFKKHEELVAEKVLPEWKIKDTVFTSGIINKNNPLKYHFDSGNFPELYSNMVCLRKDTEGGHLSIPEYDIGLAIADNSVVFFDGQSLLHGVTPITYNSEKGYRFTLVYYSLRQMWKCLPLTEEIIRIKERKAAREKARYLRLIGQLDPKDDPWADKTDDELEEESEDQIRSETR